VGERGELGVGSVDRGIVGGFMPSRSLLWLS
jgi:hypothetical protein